MARAVTPRDHVTVSYILPFSITLHAARWIIRESLTVLCIRSRCVLVRKFDCVSSQADLSTSRIYLPNFLLARYQAYDTFRAAL